MVARSQSSPAPVDSRDSSPGSDQTTNRSKAGIRVSLACVPCRSKHIKCDATMPTCLRCQLEQKPCFYAKSRRGIRDPKKRSMLCDKQPSPSSSDGLWPLTQMSTFHVPVRFVNNMPAGWSLAAKISPNSSPSTATALLLDQFYVSSFGCQPWVLPKPSMMTRIATAPNDMHFLISVMTYVASLHEETISSDELRESTFSQACGPLPMTAQSVQGLAILSTAALGEDKQDLSAGWLDRAISIALDIGMQHKSFAEAEADPVAAESYRRTYWALYILDCHRALRDNLPSFSMYGLPVTTELPCEEWEYQSGAIPHPTSLEVYDSRDGLGDMTFSSWAYTIDLFRLIGEVVLPLKLYPDEPWYDQLNRAELRITNWLVQVPKWKKEAVDSNGCPDQILYLGLGMAHSSRMRLRQPFNRLQVGLKDGFPIGPLQRPQASVHPKLDANWNVCPPDLDAVNAVCQTFSLFLSPCFYNPINTVGVSRTCLALLDACVFLGCDTPAIREKLNLAFALLKKQAEIWPLAKRLLATLREVSVTYLPPAPMNDAGNTDVAGLIPDHLWQSTPFTPRSLPAQDDILGTAFVATAPIHEGLSGECYEQWLVGE